MDDRILIGGLRHHHLHNLRRKLHVYRKKLNKYILQTRGKGILPDETKYARLATFTGDLYQIWQRLSDSLISLLKTKYKF